MGRRPCQIVNSHHFSHRRHCHYHRLSAADLWRHADGPGGGFEEAMRKWEREGGGGEEEGG